MSARVSACESLHDFVDYVHAIAPFQETVSIVGLIGMEVELGACVQASGTPVPFYGCTQNGATLQNLSLWANDQWIRGIQVRLSRLASRKIL